MTTVQWIDYASDGIFALAFALGLVVAIHDGSAIRAAVFSPGLIGFGIVFVGNTAKVFGWLP